MNLLRHPATSAFGVTAIIFMTLLAPLTSIMHRGMYHLSGSAGSMIIPLYIDFAIAWLLLTLLLLWTRRHPLADTIVWTGLGLVVLRELVEGWFWYKGLVVSRAVNIVFVLLLLASIIAVPVLYARAPESLRSAKAMAALILGFVALSGAFSLVQVALVGWQARNLNAPHPLHQVSEAAKTSPRHRIVWIVLDELSYRQLYEHRYPGVTMPAFDRLASESTVFTNVQPEGTETEEVLPALISGIPVSAIRTPTAGAPLSIKNSVTKSWEKFDPHNTVFQDALNAGYGTAVSGWYNPYCRIMPQVLDECFWTNSITLIDGMYSGQTVLENAKQLMVQTLAGRARLLRLPTFGVRERTDILPHQKNYFDLVAAGDKMLQDPTDTFLLLHMPLPHPSGFYNRHTMSFTTENPTYLDNMVLSDIYLAHVRKLLEENGSWDSTTLVIMGDHSWRVPFLWAKYQYWAPEEQIASDGGKYDPRPAYIVKLPGQTTADRIDTPFAAIRTRALFDALLQGTIATPAQLAAWAK